MQDIKRGKRTRRDAVILQVFLQACGYTVDVDATLGPAPKALRQFQADQGLLNDGVAGQKTWTCLFVLQPALLADMSSRWLSQARSMTLPRATVWVCRLCGRSMWSGRWRGLPRPAGQDPL